jgi:NADPH-dependent ferric siderophore reductase
MTDVPPAVQTSGDPFGTLTGPLAGTVRMQLTVVDSRLLTPHMQRVVLTAPELRDFEHLPGQDVMLLVDVVNDRPVRRRYTIRALDRGNQLLTLDVVRHSGGPGERWIRAATTGVTVEGIGPRGKISPAPHTDWHLFIGDDSSLAAIFAMTESLPPDATATVILEVPEPADEQELRPHAPVQLTWVHRRGRPAGQPDALVSAASAVTIPAGQPHVYLLGEARVVLALREVLEERGIKPGHMSPKAYWGRGKANASHGEPARDG